MAIHHSPTSGIGMATKNGCSWVIKWGADFSDESLSIFGGDRKWRAQSRKHGAGADWFRHSCSLVFAYEPLQSADI